VSTDVKMTGTSWRAPASRAPQANIGPDDGALAATRGGDGLRGRIRSLVILLVVTLAAGGLTLAVQRGDGLKQHLSDRKHARVLADYTDKTVVATLERLVAAIEALDAAALRLAAEPSDAALASMATAWRAARALWKETAAFQYGPAAHYNFDKQLSAWPLDRVLVDHLLDEMEAGRLDVDARGLRERRHATQRGLPAAEYVLFRDGQVRNARDLRPAELRFLTAVTGSLRLEATDFLATWVGTANLSKERARVLAAAGFEARTAYGEEIRNPGAPGSRYASASVSLQDILGDMVAAAEELCPAIEEVQGSGDPAASDTWFSHNGPADLKSTLQSVENAYLGGRAGDRGRSVSDLMAGYDEVLDRRVRIALGHTAHQIDAVGDPYGAPREDHELAVRRAVAACGQLAERLGTAALIVTMHPSTRPWSAYGVHEAAPLLPAAEM